MLGVEAEACIPPTVEMGQAGTIVGHDCPAKDRIAATGHTGYIQSLIRESGTENTPSQCQTVDLPECVPPGVLMRTGRRRMNKLSWREEEARAQRVQVTA